MNNWIIILIALAALLGPLAALALAGSPVLRRGVPRWYLLPFGFERWGSGRGYRWLGVRRFKYWLPFSGDRVALRTGRHPLRQGRLPETLDAAFQNTVLYELIHLSILIPLLPVMVVPFQHEAWVAGGFVLAMNVVINGYPIMVQRYNRVRLLRLVSAELRQRWDLPPPAVDRSEKPSPNCNHPTDPGRCS